MHAWRVERGTIKSKKKNGVCNAQAALKIGPATLTTSRHPTLQGSRRESPSSRTPTWVQNALALPSARATSTQTRVGDCAVMSVVGTCGAFVERVRSEAAAVRTRRVARPCRRKAGSTPSASTCTSKGGGDAERDVRSEVGTWRAAAMQAIGLSEEGRVAIRPRCVGWVRSWWKKVGRSAGSEGANSVCGEKDDVSWMVRVRVRGGLGRTCSARTLWMSADVRGRMTSSSTDH